MVVPPVRVQPVVMPMFAAGAPYPPGALVALFRARSIAAQPVTARSVGSVVAVPPRPPPVDQPTTTPPVGVVGGAVAPPPSTRLGRFGDDRRITPPTAA